MNIDIRKPMRSGDIEILPGSYLIGFNPDSQRISLAGRGVTHLLVAQPRPSKRKVRITEVLVGPAMGSNGMMITVRTPPQKEWITILQQAKGAKLI